MLARVQLTLAAALMVAALALGGVLLLGADGEVHAGPDAGLDVGPQGFAGSLSPPDVRPRDFALRDQDGRLASLVADRGKVVVLTFMYSTCQDTCPTTAQQIRLALDDLGARAKDVPVLAVSVDPQGDTARSTRSFLLRQSLYGRMRFLRGTPAQLTPIWAAYGVRPQTSGEVTADDHSATVLLIDRSGRQRVSFPIDHLTPEGLAHDLKRLLGRGA